MNNFQSDIYIEKTSFNKALMNVGNVNYTSVLKNRQKMVKKK